MSKANLLNLKSGDAQESDVGAALVIATASAAIAVPDYGHVTVVITKGTAAAMTIVAPTATVHDGVKVTVTSATAAAHTVTATTIGFNAGNTATDVGTFGGAVGDGISFMAYQGEWLVLNNVNVTLA